MDNKNRKNRPKGLIYKVKNNNKKNIKTDYKTLGIKFTFGNYIIIF